jgi:hypothetical protein
MARREHNIMGNGTPMTAGKIIAVAITASFMINGVAVTFTIDAMNRQEAAISKLSDKVDEKMDDRYRRFEAVEAHNSLKQRIKAAEIRDAIIEAKIDGHVREDQRIHDRQ